MQKKRLCRFCRRWFRPDARVGKRQIACFEEACRAQRRAAAQAKWSARNPEYFRARWLEERGRRSETAAVRPPLNGLPWEIAEEEFKPLGAAFLLVMCRLVLRRAQDEIRLQVIEFKRDVCRHARESAQDEIGVEVIESRGDGR